MAKATERPATPQSTVPAWEVQGKLVLSRLQDLPRVCLKCGTSSEVSYRREELSCRSERRREGVFFLTRLLPLLALFISPYEVDEASMNLPLCAACNARWDRTRLALRGLIWLVVGGFFLVFPFVASLWFFLTLVGLLAVRILAGAFLVPRWALMTVYIAPNYVAVHDIGERARETLLAPKPADGTPAG
jgi:hypothetical protein